MATAEGDYPKIGNDPIYASELNLYKGNAIEIYTGNALDISETGGGATNSYEMTAISAADLVGATYIKISMTAYFNAAGTSGARLYYKVETKEIGGSYSDSLASREICDNTSGERMATIDYYHTLTAGEKTNGVQVKLTISANANGDGTQAFTNIQIINVPV